MSSENDADRFNVNLPARWSIVAVVIVIALTVMYYFVTAKLADTTIFAAAATAAAGTVLAAIYTGRSLTHLLNEDRASRERENTLDSLRKKDRAMRFLERWNEPAMYHARDVFQSLMEDRELPHDQLVSKIEHNKTNVIHIMNFIEEIAFAYKHRLVDESLTRAQFAGIIIPLWTTLEPWINQHRKSRGRPNIWIAVEEVYSEWRSVY